MIPHVPFIEGQIDLLFAVLLALHRVADGDHGVDEIVQVHAAGQEAGGVVGGIAVVAVQGNIINVLIALVQHLQLPVPEGGHLVGGRTAGDQLDGGIDPLHHFGGFVGDAAIFHRGFVAHLPGAVHFVAQAPQLDAEGLLRAVLDAHIGELAAALVVGVFHHVPGVFGAPGAQVDGVHHLSVGFLRPVSKFVHAHRVGFRGEPGQVQSLGPLILGADGVLPVKAGHEIAAGIAHHRHADFTYLFQHIPAEALLVRHGMARLVNAAVHCAAQVLDKGTVHPRVNGSDAVALIQGHGSLFHGRVSFKHSFVFPGCHFHYSMTGGQVKRGKPCCEKFPGT